MKSNIRLQQEIFGLLKKNYKSSKACYVSVNGENVTILDSGLPIRYYPYAAKKILAKYPELDFVHFTGQWTEYFYSRNTLKWLAV